METHFTAEIDGSPVRVKNPGPGGSALTTDYGSLEEYIDMYKKHYEERRAEFFDSTLNDDDLPDKAKRWASISRTCLSLARTLSNDLGPSRDYREMAQEWADRIVKESGLRLRNLDQHYELKKSELPKGDKKLIRLSKEVEDGMLFFNRALATQIVLHQRDEKENGGPADKLMEMETKAGERAKELEERVPAGHIFLPARPFPAAEIPEGLRVPEYPEAYVRMKEVPVDDLVYDEQHDEFIIRPGYISEDGLIDDQSVIWNWDEGTVTMKLRGGEPEIWPFWKARNASDMPRGWPARYLRRKFLDLVDSLTWEVMKKR